jgi:predicted  nucleic acid-binding Zn-ribbon protein
VKATPQDQERLLALQQIDSDLIKLGHQLKNSPHRQSLENLNRKEQESKNLLIAAETEESDIKHELDRSEVDVEQVAMRIERDEKRLASGTGTPKELEQLQHELGSLAKRRAELEDVELAIMVRIEEVRKVVVALKENILEIDREIAKVKSDLEKENSEISTSESANLKSRQELSAQISPELISLYEKIRETQDGVGAARLAGDSCDGCHLKLNAAELEKIKSLPEDEVVRCEECRRVLIRVK